MTVYGNGFLAYHIEVRVNSGLADAVKATVKEWQKEFREHAEWPDFPASMVRRLKEIPGVIGVVCEGPQSSVLIPLRMVRGLTSTSCTMSAVLGTGPVTQSIEESFASWGLSLEVTRRIGNADSPVEFSFRDTSGDSSSLILYPVTRKRYRGAIGEMEKCPNHLILNRYNNRLRDLAEQVSARGGHVSLRPRELGCYDRIEHYFSLLPFTSQLVISSRHGVMKAFAQNAGIHTGRGWPDNLVTQKDHSLERLATALIEQMRPGAVLVLNRHVARDAIFFRAGEVPKAIPAPVSYGSESRAARLQGALLGRSLQRNSCLDEHIGLDVWEDCCEEVFNLAYWGTNARPWRYPCQSDPSTVI